MTRHFSMPTMLRMTPNELLKQFFERLGITLYSIDWKHLGERQPEPLQCALGWAPEQQQQQAESSLADIFELACEPGWQSILEAAIELGEPAYASQLPPEACYYERAMRTWLEHPEVFEQATFRHKVGGLTRGHKRTGLPLLKPRITPESTRELATGLSSCLRREEGRGRHCTVDYFRRSNGTDIFVAYPDDFLQTITTHDDNGRLVPRSIRKTFEMVFSLQAEEGKLELFAKVAPAIKPKLMCVFGQIILGADLSPKSYCQPFDLNRLKDRYFCLETDPADGISASISRLRLDVPRYGRFTVEPNARGGPSDIYEVIDECLIGRAVSWDDVNISLATFRFQFARTTAKRTPPLSFEVTYPDHCNIRTRQPERIELTRKYLRRWRIANA